MKNHFYFEVLRKTIVQFLDLFNEIRIARYDVNTGKLLRYISVPLKFAPKTKHWWWMEKIDKETGQTIREVTLPHIAVTMTGMEPADSSRAVNKHHKVRSRKNDVSPAKYERFDNPVPYDFNFEVKIASQFMIDVNQILEQILPFFDPTAYIRVTIPELDIDHKEEPTDEGGYPLDLKVIYESGSFDTNIDMGSDEYRTILWTLNFKVEGYLFKPNMLTPVIEHALINYFDYDSYTVDGNRNPMITSLLTGLSAEKFPMSISGGVSGLPSGSLYSHSAKLWYTYERIANDTSGDAEISSPPYSPPYNLVGSVPSDIIQGDPGSVLFIGSTGELQQDNQNLYWNDNLNRMSIGNDSPDAILDISGEGTGDYFTIQRTDTGDYFTVNFDGSTHIKSYLDMVFEIDDTEVMRVDASGFEVNGTVTASNIKNGTIAITGTSTCTIDYSEDAAIYTFAKTVPVTLALSNLPTGAWGIIIEITDDGGGDSVSYPTNWKEIGGTAMAVTTSGIDRWLITGFGTTDTNIRVSQTLDWKAS